MTPAAEASGLVEHFFRHETGRLHGALIRMMGVGRWQLAEDVAQEAMLKAMTTWSMGGVPPNPGAWITRAAMNLARDALRHGRMASEKETALVTHFEQLHDRPPAPDEEEHVRDDTLRLLFVCCRPELPHDAQVVLALKMICGFSTGEIARAFMMKEDAVDKQLVRTKQRVRDLGAAFEIPAGAALAPHLDGVLATLYLLFNEGYKASSGETLLREDLCREAVRLAAALASHPAGDTPRTHALIALMLLNAARFPSRLDDRGDLLRLGEQDRSKWHRGMIDEGLARLARASAGDMFSDYHLQAAIAACHAVAPDFASTDWSRIVLLYDELLHRKPSPAAALNRAVALSHVSGPQAALEAVDAIPETEKLTPQHLLHAVRGELLRRLGRHDEADDAYRTALSHAATTPERRHLSARLGERTPPRA